MKTKTKTKTDEKQVNITYNQFCNILVFIAIFSNNTNILTQSPDYIIEKYNRYIGYPENIIDFPEWKNGIHHVLMVNIINEYTKIWNKELRIMKIYSVLNDLKNE